ncbi:MAG: hypothetical protein ACYCPS_00295 [Candidatus Saccharimonadales bacterium]
MNKNGFGVTFEVLRDAASEAGYGGTALSLVPSPYSENEADKVSWKDGQVRYVELQFPGSIGVVFFLNALRNAGLIEPDQVSDDKPRLRPLGGSLGSGFVILEDLNCR